MLTLGWAISLRMAGAGRPLAVYVLSLSQDGCRWATLGRKAGRDFREADRDPELLLPDLLHSDLLLHPQAHHQVDQERPVRQSVLTEEES